MSKLRQAVTGTKPKTKKGKKDPDARPPSRSKARRRQKPVPASKPTKAAPKSPEEPEAVQKARARLKAMVQEASSGAPPEAVGLVLAILTQETGNHAAANTLIAEYKLDKTFGIKKF